jgi:enoyl-[acyl-carrier protein] reductase II
MYSFEGNRVVLDTGAKYPIFNAPIGYFARAQLAGAVSAAGGMGLLEMNTTGIAETATEYDEIRSRTDAPFGLHMFLQVLVAQNRVDEVLDWALGRTTFMVSCAGNPARVMPRLKDAGIKLYHQVGSLDQALKAADAGVDGLIVEGAESGGLRGANGLHIFSLLQQVRARLDLPLVAAGGIVDGHGMAGAFALGAEGVLMGTRFMSAVESPVHHNWKQAIADCDGTLNIDTGRSATRMLVVRNEFSEAVARGEVDPKGNPYAGPFQELFKNGRLDKAMAGCGESAMLITSIREVAEIIDQTVSVFWQEIERLAQLLPSSAHSTT